MPSVPAHKWTGSRIHDLRVGLGKTQEEFAELLRARTGWPCARTRVAQWEGGFHRASLKWIPIFDDLNRAAPKTSEDAMRVMEVVM